MWEGGQTRRMGGGTCAVSHMARASMGRAAVVGTLRGRTSCTLKRATAVRGSREGRRVVCVCVVLVPVCVTLPLCVKCVWMELRNLGRS